MRSDQQVPERHRRVVRALRSGPRAPERLHLQIEQLITEGDSRPSWPPVVQERPPRPWPRRALVAGGIATVLAVALVVALSLGGPGGASVVQAAELSLLPATKDAPRESPERPALLRRSFAGVTFPAWDDEFGWRATGARRDEVDGRATETVFYTHTHHRIGYTVISGPAIKPPAEAETLNAGGVKLHRFRLGFQDVVTFERGGRTCVLSGDVHDPDTLVKLASWRGDGALGF